MDNIIESVGSFGKFQFKVIFLIGLISALSSALLYATIFIAAEPTFICTKQLLNRNLKEGKSSITRSNMNLTTNFFGHHIISKKDISIPRANERNKISKDLLKHTDARFNNQTENLRIKRDTDMVEEIDGIDNKKQNESNECMIWFHIKNSNPKNMILKEFKDDHAYYECHYDKTYYDKTIINEWDLICERNYKASLTQTVHIFGSIFGFCGGILGDKLGRRRSVLIFFVLLVITLISSQFLLLKTINLSSDTKYIIFSISQFLIGLLVNCLYSTAYVLLFEFSTERYRTIISNLNSYIYVFGELITLVVYYIARDWHVLNWFIAFYSLLLLILTYYMLPESPLWLLTSSRSPDANSNANEILKTMARINGKNMPQINNTLKTDSKQKERLLKETAESSFLPIINASIKDNKPNIDEKKGIFDSNLEKNPNIDPADVCFKEFHEFEEGNFYLMIKQLFVPRKNLIKTVLLFFIWISLMLIYYGVTLGVTSIELVDPYLMYFVHSVADILGIIICYINDIIGRKKTITCFLFTTALMYALIAFVTEYNTSSDNDPFSTKAIYIMSFALIGKCAVSASYNIAYIYTSELYPTSIRNTALLFLICFGSTSSLVAPQINILKSLVWNPLPYIIYSVFALFSIVCVYFLPDTEIKRYKLI